MIHNRPAALVPAGCLLLAFSVLGFLATSSAASDQPSGEDIASLIEQLGDPDFAVRDRAQERLADLGEAAYNALTIAANDPDLEIAARARYLLRTIEMPVVRETDSECVKNTLAEYSDLATEDQLLRVRVLMTLPEGQGYRAACRLAHIENSVIMSKYIATTILNNWPVHDQGRTRMQEAVDAELKQSGRQAARWLVDFARLDSDSKADPAPFRNLVEEEESLLRQRSPRTGERVVVALLCTLAYSETLRGESDPARKHFERAQQLAFAHPESPASFSFEMADYFKSRGMIDWAAEVYKKVSEAGDARFISYAHWELAEMFHDAGRDAEAVAALDATLGSLGGERLKGSDILSTEQVRARKHFFLACLARDRSEDEKLRAELLDALKNDPNELDSLIALYRIPDLEEPVRKNVTAMIETAAGRLRQEANAAPEDASAHNEFAWVVGNTTGDMQEALKHALRAVELRPESGACLDTLAHVYFYGLKDIGKAVETQAKAVEFSPHSGLIRQKYELFRKAASEQKIK